MGGVYSPGQGKDQIVAVAVAACSSKGRKARWAALAVRPPTGGGARFSLTPEKTHLTGHLPLSGQLAAGDKDSRRLERPAVTTSRVSGTACCPVGCLRGSRLNAGSFIRS
ncbi:hypothetical protein D623_10003237 [Myotis brandtii]|uniref:Uncharacterized protein n=1 Tax=Myotis brandtii TaxID=109478 RepID=S7MER5_MYOBR|nr:hypothetical protein D623_10003237 [Myotis brandtii]